MIGEPFAHTYLLTLPTEPAARAVAGELAGRGHRLVAVRAVDPAGPGRPEFAGWWDVFSVFCDPFAGTVPPETAAVEAIARGHGGVCYGPGGGAESTVLRTFIRDGLVHELTAEEAERRRTPPAPPVPSRPAPPSAPPLRYRATPDEGAERAAVAERLTAGGHLDDEEVGDDAGEMVDALFDSVLHQGTCGPETAAAVPDLVALATDSRIGDRLRSWILVGLFVIATVGRRALNRPAVEPPEAAAARVAVSASMGRLTARWDQESDLVRFCLAALVAACPEDGAAVRAAIGDLRAAVPGTGREAALRLAEALADTDPPRIVAALRDIDADGSPYATPDQNGLRALMSLLTPELGRATVVDSRP